MTRATDEPGTAELRHWFRENFRRALRRKGWNYLDLAQATGINLQTLRKYGSQGISRTSKWDMLNRLVQALGLASVDELFVDPNPSAPPVSAFGTLANPGVTQVLETNPELREQLGPDGVAELYSIRGVGGPLTIEGALQSARRILWRREVLRKCAIVLESHHSDTLSKLIDLAYNDLSIDRGHSNNQLGKRN